MIRLLWALLISLALVNGAIIIVFLAGCHPFARLYDYTVPGTCLSMAALDATIYVQGGMFPLKLPEGDSMLSLYSFFATHGSSMLVAAYLGVMESSNLVKVKDCNLCFDGAWPSVILNPPCFNLQDIIELTFDYSTSACLVVRLVLTAQYNGDLDYSWSLAPIEIWKM